jgi:hypothetical protein
MEISVLAVTTTTPWGPGRAKPSRVEDHPPPLPACQGKFNLIERHKYSLGERAQSPARS